MWPANIILPVLENFEVLKILQPSQRWPRATLVRRCPELIKLSLHLESSSVCSVAMMSGMASISKILPASALLAQMSEDDFFFLRRFCFPSKCLNFSFFPGDFFFS